MKKIRLGTVFSGIGAIEFALRRLGINYEQVFACDNGERDDIKIDYDKEFTVIRSLDSIDKQQEYVEKLYSLLTKRKNFVQESYLANYCCPSNRFFQDIKLMDGTPFKGQIDLLVGGSPCQSFSSVGFQGGLDDTRGTLFFDFARLIKETKPKVFIYENVRNLIHHDRGKTWETIINVFHELGYNIDHKVLNALDFGIPQKRSRLFVVGFAKEFGIIPNIPQKKKNIEEKYTMQDFLLSRTGVGCFSYRNGGELSLDYSSPSIVDEKYYLSTAVKKYVMKGGTKSWYQKPEIDLPIARTLLKTMGNCHRAGVDNYVTENGRIRMLTEREALRLMGFTDDYKIVVSSAQTYKQAGNSIVVDVMIEIIKYILSEGVLDD